MTVSPAADSRLTWHLASDARRGTTVSLDAPGKAGGSSAEGERLSANCLRTVSAQTAAGSSAIAVQIRATPGV